MRYRWIIMIAILSLILVAASCAGVPETTPAPATTPATTTPPSAPAPTPSPEPSSGPTLPPAAEPKPSGEPTVVPDEFYRTTANHFGFMPAFHDYALAKDSGGLWTRPHFEQFTWGWIEPRPGIYDFMQTDKIVREAQAYGFHILANVQPRAYWDEQQCYQGIPNPPPGMPPRFDGAHKPCDLDAYQKFVTAMVERYDGDGRDDMPGLSAPIKHWEIMNEPEFQNYFLGTPGDYVEIAKASYAAIKSADPEAVVVQGGMAGMNPEMTGFWQQVFILQVGDYFDVMNMHSIGHGEHLNLPAFKKFLEANGITDKPIWVTEVQYQQAFESQDFTTQQFAETMARSYIFALANGVDKLLYVNLKTPQFSIGQAPFDERSALVDNQGQKTPLYYAHHTIADKLGTLSNEDTVEIIREVVGNWHIDQGQYKFIIDGETIYALWGSGQVPAEIQGTVTITDIDGTSRTADASTIRLTNRPIFVQLP